MKAGKRSSLSNLHPAIQSGSCKREAEASKLMLEPNLCIKVGGTRRFLEGSCLRLCYKNSNHKNRGTAHTVANLKLEFRFLLDYTRLSGKLLRATPFDHLVFVYFSWGTSRSLSSGN